MRPACDLPSSVLVLPRVSGRVFNKSERLIRIMLSHTIQALAADTWQTYFAGALASHWTVAAANNSSVSLQVADFRTLPLLIFEIFSQQHDPKWMCRKTNNNNHDLTIKPGWGLRLRPMMFCCIWWPSSNTLSHGFKTRRRKLISSSLDRKNHGKPDQQGLKRKSRHE